MSWNEVKSAPKAKALQQAAVAMGATLGTGRARRRIFITLRPELISDCSAWLHFGATVKVLIGVGEHAGILRIVPGGAIKVVRVCGRGAPSLAVVINLFVPPVPLPLAPGAQKVAPVEFDNGAEWIEITLPAWACAPAAKAPAQIAPPLLLVPAAAALLPEPARDGRTEPFRGIASRTGVEGVRTSAVPIGAADAR